MIAQPALVLQGISKSFGATRVLDNVELRAAPGEFVAIVGPSGCGKSTLLKIVAGLEQPDSGAVVLDGADVTARRAADRDMAMVFQSYALYPHLTVRQNMSLPLVMRRLSATERLPLIARFNGATRGKLAAIAKEVEQAADMLRLTPLLARKPGQLSGGQRQRVALGRAIVRRPRAFLMDEPLSNLDAALRVHTRAEIVDLHRRAGVVTLYVTHDQEEALGMADRIAVIINGRILQVAAPARIYNDPAHLDVATFIGSPRINLLAGTMSANGQAMFGESALIDRVEAPANVRVQIGVRSEHVALSETPKHRSFAIRPERVEFLGAEARLHARIEGQTELFVARLSPERAGELKDKRVLYASANPEHVFAFDAFGARLVHGAPTSIVAPSHAA